MHFTPKETSSEKKYQTPIGYGSGKGPHPSKCAEIDQNHQTPIGLWRCGDLWSPRPTPVSALFVCLLWRLMNCHRDLRFAQPTLMLLNTRSEKENGNKQPMFSNNHTLEDPKQIETQLYSAQMKEFKEKSITSWQRIQNRQGWTNRNFIIWIYLWMQGSKKKMRLTRKVKWMWIQRCQRKRMGT